MDTGPSNEASERSRPATTSGVEVLSISPIARLTKPPRRLSVELFLRTSNPRSVLTEEDLSDIRGRFGFPNEVQLRLPFKDERADTVSEGWIFDVERDEGFLGIDCTGGRSGRRAICQHYSSRQQLAFSFWDTSSIDHDPWNFLGDSKLQSMGGLANAFYPLWGTLRKELKKPPPKALLFEKKLERLLAQPNREWDEINVPKRFRASSLWKDFVELPSGIAKRVPSWVDWPFVIGGALRRLFGPPLFIEPLSDEEALIAEFALDTMSVAFPSAKDLLAKNKAKKEAEKAAKAAADASASSA
ncbi:hypothetical protein TIFTF001_036052 [Ficus carica]|uniref:Uncharacterized protein n=1 Tax=Ficus carica TaxID=3494 RepID=A0AA88E2M5_FICCA|nr:hypothetical protein TIFTF001_036052 [Ficus carica]